MDFGVTPFDGLHRLVDAGNTLVETASFENPVWVPQGRPRPSPAATPTGL
jgi:pantothenate kinase type III